jgi:hypothetical protein
MMFKAQKKTECKPDKNEARDVPIWHRGGQTQVNAIYTDNYIISRPAWKQCRFQSCRHATTPKWDTRY